MPKINPIIKFIIEIPIIRQPIESLYQYYMRRDGGLSFERELVKSQTDHTFIDLEEQMSPIDVMALLYLVKSVKHRNMITAEIGSWKGKSASVVSEVVAEQHGKVFCIDHWQGNVDAWCEPLAQEHDIFAMFRNNMKLRGLWLTTVFPMVMPSNEGYYLFQNGCFDLLFIDGDHRYEVVRQDIINWLPKVKSGGIICGHDICHDGVLKSVNELIPEYKVFKNSYVWYYRLP